MRLISENGLAAQCPKPMIDCAMKRLTRSQQREGDIDRLSRRRK
jgi:hypothetical protein